MKSDTYGSDLQVLHVSRIDRNRVKHSAFIELQFDVSQSLTRVRVSNLSVSHCYRTYESAVASKMKEELLGIFEKLPPSVKAIVGAMISLQLLGFGAWIFMMVREGRIKKEKQS